MNIPNANKKKREKKNTEDFGNYLQTYDLSISGIFDCIERTWSIYTDVPQVSEPILVIPIQLRDSAALQNGKIKK